MKKALLIVPLAFTLMFGNFVLNYLEQLAPTLTDGETALLSLGSGVLCIPMTILLIGLGRRWSTGSHKQ